MRLQATIGSFGSTRANLSQRPRPGPPSPSPREDPERPGEGPSSPSCGGHELRGGLDAHAREIESIGVPAAADRADDQIPALIETVEESIRSRLSGDQSVGVVADGRSYRLFSGHVFSQAGTALGCGFWGTSTCSCRWWTRRGSTSVVVDHDTGVSWSRRRRTRHTVASRATTGQGLRWPSFSRRCAVYRANGTRSRGGAGVHERAALFAGAEEIHQPRPEYDPQTADGDLNPYAYANGSPFLLH